MFRFSSDFVTPCCPFFGIVTVLFSYFSVFVRKLNSLLKKTTEESFSFNCGLYFLFQSVNVYQGFDVNIFGTGKCNRKRFPSFFMIEVCFLLISRPICKMYDV